MREIKFRAWDKLTSKMLYWEYLLSVHPSINLFFNEPDVELMQYTGLKDKNGKEIYERDIIQEQTIMIGHTGKVFQQGSGEWSVSYRRGSHPFYIPDGFENSIETHSLQDWASDKRIVVIGNIYENPELLSPNVAKA